MWLSCLELSDQYSKKINGDNPIFYQDGKGKIPHKRNTCGRPFIKIVKVLLSASIFSHEELVPQNHQLHSAFII